MNSVGDYFALGLVLVLCVFFFDNKISLRYMTAASKIFIICLISTVLTALLDLGTLHLLLLENVPVWVGMLINTAYFVMNIISTSAIA